jgi:K+-transporting ATPase KdpF subunit
VARGGNGSVICRDGGIRDLLRSIDGGQTMIENILLTIISLLVLIYLFIALLRPEIF